MNVRFLTPARTEVREVISYYNQQREGLGVEFALELKDALLRIRNYITVKNRTVGEIEGMISVCQTLKPIQSISFN